MTKSTPTRRTIFVLAQLCISAALLLYLLRQIDMVKLIGLWSDLRQPFVWLAIGLQLGGVLISSLKWWLLLRASGQPMPYGWTVRVYLIGQFFGNFLPTMIGGDAVRVYYLTRRSVRPAVAIASVFVERITGFLALTVIGALALGISSNLLANAPQLLLGVVGSLLTAGAAVLVALAAPWGVRFLVRLRLPNLLGWRRKLGSFAESLAIYYAFPRTLALVIALAFGYQICWIIENYAVTHALGLAAPPAFVAFMVPISDIIGLIPIFFNSLGAREGTFVLLLGRLGVPAESALAAAFLIFAIRLVSSLLGGLLYALGGFERLRGEAAGNVVSTRAEE